jgi:ribosomal protein L1
LEKYFYLKKQRNSILHIGQDSASHKTLLKNIAEAIALMIQSEDNAEKARALVKELTDKYPLNA